MQKLNKSYLEKAASMLLQLNEANKSLSKRAEATKLLFQQVEFGQIPAPRSISEYEEKIASLMDKDLKVLGEAVKLASSGSFSAFGTLEAPVTMRSGVDSARDEFNAHIMNLD